MTILHQESNAAAPLLTIDELRVELEQQIRA